MTKKENVAVHLDALNEDLAYLDEGEYCIQEALGYSFEDMVEQGKRSDLHDTELTSAITFFVGNQLTISDYYIKDIYGRYDCLTEDEYLENVMEYENEILQNIKEHYLCRGKEDIDYNYSEYISAKLDMAKNITFKELIEDINNIDLLNYVGQDLKDFYFTVDINDNTYIVKSDKKEYFEQYYKEDVESIETLYIDKIIDGEFEVVSTRTDFSLILQYMFDRVGLEKEISDNIIDL